MWFADRVALELLAPVAVWVLASGLDDLVLDLSWFWLLLRSKLQGAVSAAPGIHSPEPRIAIIVPCWREDAVIERMVSSNLADIEYGNYDIWLALYPDDHRSIAAARRAQSQTDRLHWMAGARRGPTTKADNLNQLISGLLLQERNGGPRYEIFLLHDAEDKIHPLELKQVARALRRHHMVQLPVLPLLAPVRNLTHGVYGDEFAEFHFKELRVRAALGGFIPSAGVATGLRREVIESFRIIRGEETLNPRSLTEDYFLGLDVYALGFRQTFSHVRAPESGELIATRAYFPDTFRAAVRQRARWVAGNNLQAWERFGWKAGRRQLYWLWRDRKGLLSQLPNLLAAMLFIYALARWGWEAFSGTPWALAEAIGSRPLLSGILLANAYLIVWRLSIRSGIGWRAYGWKHASLALPRMIWASAINLCASYFAVREVFAAKRNGRPMTWAKTAHSFPSRTDSSASGD